MVRNFYEIKKTKLRICCDLNEAILRKIKGKYPLIKTATDYNEALHDEEVDTIVIATSTSTLLI